MKSKMGNGVSMLVLSLVLTGLTLRAVAGDDRSAASLAGTWQVTVTSTNSQAHHEQTLKLKLDGGSLTGTLSHASTVNGKSRVFEYPIGNVKLQGSEISFSFTHRVEAGRGPDVKSSYQGRISTNRIIGTLQDEWMGHAITRDWEAARRKE